MTEQPKAAPQRAAKPSTLWTTVNITAAALAGSFAISTGLAVQLSKGNDPVLGPKLEAARVQAVQEAAQRRAQERARRRARAERQRALRAQRAAEAAAAASGAPAPVQAAAVPAAPPPPPPAPVVTRAS
jgi:hypothetical protein